MNSEFDATQIWDGPIEAEVIAEQERTVEHLMQRPNALANAKLHAENELQRLINISNRLAWGSVPADLRQPSPDERAVLLARLSPEDQEKLLTHARLAAAQRNLTALMAEAHEQCLARLRAEQEELAHQEEEAHERAEFEAFDAAGKEERFLAWRAARQGRA